MGSERAKPYFRAPASTNPTQVRSLWQKPRSMNECQKLRSLSGPLGGQNTLTVTGWPPSRVRIGPDRHVGSADQSRRLGFGLNLLFGGFEGRKRDAHPECSQEQPERRSGGQPRPALRFRRSWARWSTGGHLVAQPRGHVLAPRAADGRDVLERTERNERRALRAVRSARGSLVHRTWLPDAEMAHGNPRFDAAGDGGPRSARSLPDGAGIAP